MQENSSSLHGLQNITTCSAFVDSTSSSTLEELVICGANNEECLRSGIQKCLTSFHFIAAAEELSYFNQNCLDWLSWESVTEFKNFFSKTHKKSTTQITPTATQFNFRVAETAVQNCDSKFIPGLDQHKFLSRTSCEFNVPHCIVLYIFITRNIFQTTNQQVWPMKAASNDFFSFSEVNVDTSTYIEI